MYSIIDPREDVGGQEGQDDLQTIFKIPMLAGGKYYTIVASKYVLNSHKQGDEETEVEADDATGESSHHHHKVKGQVYISYHPEDTQGQYIAEYCSNVVFKRYDVPHVLFGPLDGVYTYEDFEKNVQESEFFLAVFSEQYMTALESGQGRVYQEMMAACSSLHPSKMITLCDAEYNYPSLTWRQTLEPPVLRRAFVPKTIRFHRHRGFQEVFEQALLAPMPGIVPDVLVSQQPLYSALERHALGQFARPLLLKHGHHSVRDLQALSNEDLVALGMNRMQQEKLIALVKAEMACPPPPIIPPNHMNAKRLVEILWSSGRDNPAVRAVAAEEIRRLSTTEKGSAEIRTFAGFESLYKMVTEGSMKEKAAALWALRNFAANDAFRSKLATSEVIADIPALLESPDVDVVHATANLCRTISVGAAGDGVGELGRSRVLRALVEQLGNPFRGIKASAVAAVGNLAILASVRERVGRMNAIARIVPMVGSADDGMVALAVSALHNLVQTDSCRLKAWRCGGVDKLKIVAQGEVMGLSEIAEDTLQVLMAGPRIQPLELFRTPKGRRMDADAMRTTIRRLNNADGVEFASTLLSAAGPDGVPSLPSPTSKSMESPARAWSQPMPPTSARGSRDSSLGAGRFHNSPGRAMTVPASLGMPPGPTAAENAWGELTHGLESEPLPDREVYEDSYGVPVSAEAPDWAAHSRPGTVNTFPGTSGMQMGPRGSGGAGPRGMVMPGGGMGDRQMGARANSAPTRRNLSPHQMAAGPGPGHEERLHAVYEQRPPQSSRAARQSRKQVYARYLANMSTTCFGRVLTPTQEQDVVERLHNSRLPWKRPVQSASPRYAGESGGQRASSGRRMGSPARANRMPPMRPLSSH